MLQSMTVGPDADVLVRLEQPSGVLHDKNSQAELVLHRNVIVDLQ